MKWKVFVPCDSRGEPHLKLPIMTDCFTAVVAIHKEGNPSLIRGPRPPCVGVLQTCSASQLIYINIQSAVSLLLLLRLLSLYQLAYACLHSLAILPPSAPRSLLTTRREEGGGKPLNRDLPPNTRLIWVAIPAALPWVPFHAKLYILKLHTGPLWLKYSGNILII